MSLIITSIVKQYDAVSTIIDVWSKLEVTIQYLRINLIENSFLYTFHRQSGACVAQRKRNGLPRDGPGFDSRWERSIYRVPRPSQGTVNGGAVSK